MIFQDFSQNGAIGPKKACFCMVDLCVQWNGQKLARLSPNSAISVLLWLWALMKVFWNHFGLGSGLGLHENQRETLVFKDSELKNLAAGIDRSCRKSVKNDLIILRESWNSKKVVRYFNQMPFFEGSKEWKSVQIGKTFIAFSLTVGFYQFKWLKLLRQAYMEKLWKKFWGTLIQKLTRKRSFSDYFVSNWLNIEFAVERIWICVHFRCSKLLQNTLQVRYKKNSC